MSNVLRVSKKVVGIRQTRNRLNAKLRECNKKSHVPNPTSSFQPTHSALLTTENEELETFFSQERVNDKSTTSEIETAYIHDDPQEIFDEDILSSAIGDLNFEEPDSDVEFDDTQSQAAEESDDDSWSDEELNSTETT
ncbi:hypothetical protein DAPPUDRAFT_330440 [Daphnia pulex]|uniref:Uncharacterized protein n=1 Tax=Daphnia pulex TaxID=6669 RepID=E9HJK8_DAPPU|nr:hypothetical protein DAPPUDRAFT_330440 [Daphnia pulex]|eukprot:EFX68110.1 hypothetical protein DAPPUDRAFT_330440 [Daphnia pulex]